ncbi:hypothetical protein PPO43_00785 [Saprospira sp. CCB-QB6]|uniref:hypothetical protein n=1 Tax=Saprospira sp. CCB-QB6 TaxID=3023936 RepID=UPI00234AE711|nr:hypothetical protein [Saprospira sp. CCB-QB6]WCL81631.1 hypothetical protein PPO43_00785 [Saprospira sp. CCB-QB6]
MVKVTWPKKEGKQNLELYLIVLRYLFKDEAVQLTKKFNFDPLEVFGRYLGNEITPDEYLNYMAIPERFLAKPDYFRDHLSKEVLWNRLALLCMPEDSDEEYLWESLSYIYTYGEGLGCSFPREDRTFSKVDLA